MPRERTAYVLSLGCPKNLVDSEVMLGHLAQDGYVPVQDPDGADVVVVNTCAFIDSAKEESVDAILELSELKRARPDVRLVVAGCLSQRYAPDLAQEIPEVDHFLGTGNFEQITGVLRGETPAPGGRSGLKILGQGSPDAATTSVRPSMAEPAGPVTALPDPDFTLRATSPRLQSNATHTAYLKVSEGCSNTCAFCIIPKLRGDQRSRPVEDVVAEAARLLEQGVVELNLIAQDLCAYGRDLSPKSSLGGLLEALDQLAQRYPGPIWIRCLYAYPKGLTRRVMEVMAGSRHIVPYLDMPLQHIADPILRRMRRGTGGPATRDLIGRLRDTIPNLTLRTTFITGLPGETDQDFEEVLDFCREARFENLGVFAYSPEEDTPAADMDDQVPAEVAQSRRDALMALQQEISRAHQASLVGTRVDVLVEGVSEETELLLRGRHPGQAPDIDGVTYITDGTANVGEVVPVVIEQSADYDLAGPITQAE